MLPLECPLPSFQKRGGNASFVYEDLDRNVSAFLATVPTWTPMACKSALRELSCKAFEIQLLSLSPVMVDKPNATVCDGVMDTLELLCAESCAVMNVTLGPVLMPLSLQPGSGYDDECISLEGGFFNEIDYPECPGRLVVSTSLTPEIPIAGTACAHPCPSLLLTPGQQTWLRRQELSGSGLSLVGALLTPWVLRRYRQHAHRLKNGGGKLTPTPPSRRASGFSFNSPFGSVSRRRSFSFMKKKQGSRRFSTSKRLTSISHRLVSMLCWSTALIHGSCMWGALREPDLICDGIAAGSSSLECKVVGAVFCFGVLLLQMLVLCKAHCTWVMLSQKTKLSKMPRWKKILKYKCLPFLISSLLVLSLLYWGKWGASITPSLFVGICGPFQSPFEVLFLSFYLPVMACTALNGFYMSKILWKIGKEYISSRTPSQESNGMDQSKWWNRAHLLRFLSSNKKVGHDDMCRWSESTTAQHNPINTPTLSSKPRRRSFQSSTMPPIISSLPQQSGLSIATSYDINQQSCFLVPMDSSLGMTPPKPSASINPFSRQTSATSLHTVTEKWAKIEGEIKEKDATTPSLHQQSGVTVTNEPKRRRGLQQQDDLSKTKIHPNGGIIVASDVEQTHLGSDWTDYEQSSLGVKMPKPPYSKKELKRPAPITVSTPSIRKLPKSQKTGSPPSIFQYIARPLAFWFWFSLIVVFLILFLKGTFPKNQDIENAVNGFILCQISHWESNEFDITKICGDFPRFDSYNFFAHRCCLTLYHSSFGFMLFVLFGLSKARKLLQVFHSSTWKKSSDYKLEDEKSSNEKESFGVKKCGCNLIVYFKAVFKAVFAQSIEEGGDVTSLPSFSKSEAVFRNVRVHCDNLAVERNNCSSSDRSLKIDKNNHQTMHFFRDLRTNTNKACHFGMHESHFRQPYDGYKYLDRSLSNSSCSSVNKRKDSIDSFCSESPCHKSVEEVQEQNRYPPICSSAMDYLHKTMDT